MVTQIRSGKINRRVLLLLLFVGDIPDVLSFSDGGDGESADDGIVLFPARVALLLYL